MASKVTTGLVGLAVESNAIPKLRGYYSNILKLVSSMPPEAEYRKKTEAVTKHRIAMLDKYTDVNLLEQNIGGGQIEEVLSQAKNEYKLARGMLQWKPWEPLIKDSPPGQWDWP